MSNPSSSESSESGTELVFLTNQCDLCLLPISPDDKTVWKQVMGWVGGPKKDSMRLREDTGKFAHDECVQRLQNGQAPDQETLFEEQPREARVYRAVHTGALPELLSDEAPKINYPGTLIASKEENRGPDEDGDPYADDPF